MAKVIILGVICGIMIITLIALSVADLVHQHKTKEFNDKCDTIIGNLNNMRKNPESNKKELKHLEEEFINLFN